MDAASGCDLGNNAETAWAAKGEAGVARARGDSKNTFVDLTEAEAQVFADAVANVAAEYVASVGGDAALAAMKGE